MTTLSASNTTSVFKFIKDQSFVIDCSSNLKNSRINNAANICLLPLYTVKPEWVEVFTKDDQEKPTISPINKALALILVIPATVCAVALKIFAFLGNPSTRANSLLIEDSLVQDKLESANYSDGTLQIFGGYSGIKKIHDVGHREAFSEIPGGPIEEDDMEKFDPSLFGELNFGEHSVVKGTYGEEKKHFIAIRYTFIDPNFPMDEENNPLVSRIKTSGANRVDILYGRHGRVESTNTLYTLGTRDGICDLDTDAISRYSSLIQEGEACDGSEYPVFFIGWRG